MERAQVNGVELEYEVVGSGEPVLLISPVLADGFLPLLSEPALADRYQLIRYHKRGWVGSTHTAPPVSVADHAVDAAALLEHLGVPRAHVAGHSTGAVVAAQLAIDHPGTVQTLTLLEPLLLSVPSGEAFLQQAGPAFEAYGNGDHEGAWAIFLSAVSGLDWATCRALLEKRSRARWRRRSRTPTPSSASSCLPPPSGRSVPSRQPPSACPVLSVLGTDTLPLWVEVAAVPAVVVPARRGVHDRGRRPSPAHPAARARRPGDGRVPRAQPDGRRLTSRPAALGSVSCRWTGDLARRGFDGGPSRRRSGSAPGTRRSRPRARRPRARRRGGPRRSAPAARPAGCEANRRVEESGLAVDAGRHRTGRVDAEVGVVPLPPRQPAVGPGRRPTRCGPSTGDPEEHPG